MSVSSKITFLFKKLFELKNLQRNHWLKLITIGFVGGSVPFLLFFKGLSMMSASNAAFIHKTLFIWVAIFAFVFLKERLSKIQILALIFLVFGVYVFLDPSGFSLGYGELLVFMATIFWALENVISKYILKEISPIIVGWGRMFFGSFFLPRLAPIAIAKKKRSA